MLVAIKCEVDKNGGMTGKPSSISQAIALMMERIPRQLYDRRGPAEIHPGQWAALRYFASANESARTSKGLSAYLGLTQAPASRAIGSLLKKDLLQRVPHPTDRRSAILSITPKGQELLQTDPIQWLGLAIDGMSQRQKIEFAQALEKLSQSLHRLRQSE